jgi:hypothetical protein
VLLEAPEFANRAKGVPSENGFADGLFTRWGSSEELQCFSSKLTASAWFKTTLAFLRGECGRTGNVAASSPLTMRAFLRTLTDVGKSLFDEKVMSRPAIADKPRLGSHARTLTQRVINGFTWGKPSQTLCAV